MRLISIAITAIVIMVLRSTCYAGCECDVWINRGGYCVDYVKSKIPTFPVPKSVAAITVLKNREPQKVENGDVAIFDLGNYWHVAYVEKVHRNQWGKATAIDVSEMNFGGQLSFNEYRKMWNSKNKNEWKNAICCGVTDRYDQISKRNNIALNSIEQIWSPESVESVEPQENTGEQGNTFADKAREAINRLIQFTGREL